MNEKTNHQEQSIASYYDMPIFGNQADLNLLAAIQAEKSSEVAKALTQGADVNAAFGNITSMVWEAFRHSNSPEGCDIFENLVDKGMDISGYNLLTQAAGDIGGHGNKLAALNRMDTVLATYQKKGLDINEKSKDGKLAITPLQSFLSNACFMKTEEQQKKYAKILNRMLELGGNPNTPMYGSKSPLMLAVEANNPELVSELLRYGADISYKSKDGLSAFSKINTNSKEGQEISKILKLASEKKMKASQQTSASRNDLNVLLINEAFKKGR